MDVSRLSTRACMAASSCATLRPTASRCAPARRMRAARARRAPARSCGRSPSRPPAARIPTVVSSTWQLLQIGGAPIDLVIVNLYPFEATVAKGAPFPECIENIDIGGPTMARHTQPTATAAWPPTARPRRDGPMAQLPHMAGARGGEEPLARHNRRAAIRLPRDHREHAGRARREDARHLRAEGRHCLHHHHRHDNSSSNASVVPLQAFSHTATYDTAIAEWMQSQLCSGRTGVHTLK